MLRSRSIPITFALIAACCLGVPAAAGAEALLSGYGGPGAGSQAILGAQLLNGPEGPGSGGSGESATSSAPNAGSAPETSTTGGGTRPQGPAAPRSRAGVSGAVHARALAGSALGSSALNEASSSQVFTGDDIIYGLLVLLALACIAALTRRAFRAGTVGANPSGSRDAGQNPI